MLDVPVRVSQLAQHALGLNTSDQILSGLKNVMLMTLLVGIHFMIFSVNH